MENVLFSMCFLGVPCRYHGRSVPSPAKFEKLSKQYNLIPICPEQLGGMPTPRPASPLKNKEGQTLFNIKGKDVSQYFINGASITLFIDSNSNFLFSL